MKSVIVAISIFLLSACSSPDSATKALSRAGYSKINITGYAFFGCSEDDFFHTGFTAVGPTGVRVEGVVCSGFLKGSTIRLN